MRKKAIFKIFLLPLFLGIVYACVNEDDEDGIFGFINKSVPKEVVAAQAWYSANVGETVVFKIADAQEETFVQPVWSTAVMKQNSEYETVEVIVRSDKMFFLYDNEILAKYEETQNGKYITSRTLFVVRTDRKTGETDGFFMTVTPNLAYLEETEMHPYRNFTYLERDKHFGGYVYYHHLDGNYSNAWKYVDGKPYAMYLPEYVAEPELPKQKVVARSKPVPEELQYNCYAEINWSWVKLPLFTYTPPQPESPEDAWYGGDLPEVVIVALVREANNLPLSVNIECEVVNDDGGGGGGGGGGGSGGGGSGGGGSGGGGGGSGGGTDTGNGDSGGGGGGGYTGNPSKWAPKASKIFKNSNMSQKTWENLEKLLEKIDDNCLGLALYNGLVSSLNGKQLPIQFTNGNSNFSYTDGTMYLDVNAESNFLFHEMWHAYQAYQETQASYASSTLNQEIEAWYAQYLYVSSLPEYHNKSSNWYRWYNHKNSKLGRAVRDISLYISNKGTLQNNSNNHSANTYWNDGLIPTFRADEEYCKSIYKYDANRTTVSNFKNLQTLSKNCNE